MRASLRWKGNVWVTQGQRKRILVSALTDLRLWYIRAFSATHLRFLLCSHFLFQLWLLSVCLFLLFYSHFSHHLLLSAQRPLSLSVHVCGDSAICLLYVPHTYMHMLAHTDTHTYSPMTVHLRRSDCVNLSQCHATLQFAIFLTGSYWLAHTLVILPVSHPPVQSPHLHLRIVFRYPFLPPPYIHASILSLSHLL